MNNTVAMIVSRVFLQCRNIRIRHDIRRLISDCMYGNLIPIVVGNSNHLIQFLAGMSLCTRFLRRIRIGFFQQGGSTAQRTIQHDFYYVHP